MLKVNTWEGADTGIQGIFQKKFDLPWRELLNSMSKFILCPWLIDDILGEKVLWMGGENTRGKQPKIGLPFHY